MPKFLLNLPSGDFSWLKERSLDTGVPMSELIRRALSLYKKGEQGCSLVISGAVTSGAVFLLKV